MKFPPLASFFLSATLLVGVTAPAQANFNLIDWAVGKAKSSVRVPILTKVAEAIKDCAMSTTCIPGQDIIMVTHRIEQNKVFACTGECFEAKDPNLARPVGQRIAREISQRSGLPIVFSHVRGNYFIFGVPRSR